MIKKICLSNLSIMIFMVTILLFSSNVVYAEVVGQPKLDGTFIQEDLMKDWNDEKWISELQYLKDAGMNYIILGAVAQNDPEGQYTMLTNYPTSIDGCAMKENHQDTVDICLRNAKKLGMKVFIGTNCRSDWFQHMASDEQWLYDRMNESNLLADELWEKYKSKYPDTFYGWYWCYEVDNANYNTTERRERLANALNIILDHLNSSNEKMPFMLCPFMNAKCGSPENYENMWKYIFERTHFTEGDIFAPQDSVGGGGTNISNFAEWFRALKRAVDTKPGLELWSDLETFDHNDWTAATIDRIYTQMNEIKPYVNNYITFAYSHYQSPNNINQGYHKTYLDYLNNGEVEAVCPSLPNKLSAKILPTGGISLEWEEAQDNIGVCGYYIYRNGELLDKLQLRRKIKKPEMPKINTSYFDDSVNPQSLYTYEVKAFDFAGNESNIAGPVKVMSSTKDIFPNNVALGCSYNIHNISDDESKNSNEYPDTNNKELTDGILVNSADYSNDAWQGWYKDSREVVVDLGSVKKVQQFIASCLYDRDLEIFLPESMIVSISIDGETYTEIGELAIPTKVTNNNYKLGLTLDNFVTARYVKLVSKPGGLSWTWPCWTFIDEVEIRNNDNRELPNLISKNCIYTVEPLAHENYPDTNNKELTDESYAESANYLDSRWQGFDAGTREIVIDLGSDKKVQQVIGSFLYNPEYYMYLPNTATVFISNDGLSYSEIGCLHANSNNICESTIKMDLSLDQAVDARYVKLIISGGAWIFADEVEVRNNFKDLPNNVSKDSKYSVKPAAHQKYPDNNNEELTDECYANSTNYLDTEWQGWDEGTREIIIDLGCQKLLRQICGEFLNNPENYMYPPRLAIVSVSIDGENYEEIGTLDSCNYGNDTCKLKQYITLDTPIQAQYVKLVITGGAWIFIDELECRI